MDRKLNWPRLIILRLGSKPKSLQTHRILFENTKNPLSTKAKKRQIFQKSIFIGKLFLQKSPWYGSSGRSAKWKMLVHWSSFFHLFLKNWTFTTTKHTFTSRVWFQPQFFMKKHFFIWSHLGFISWRILYSLLRRVRHNSKIWPRKRPSK